LIILKLANSGQIKVLDDIDSSNNIESLPRQTCTCIGGWHYDRRLYDRKGYKSAREVVNQLVDVVIQSLASGIDLYAKRIQQVQLLGVEAPLRFTRDEKGLQVTLPENKVGDHAYVLKVMS
jgi:hypothetical protein